MEGRQARCDAWCPYRPPDCSWCVTLIVAATLIALGIIFCIAAAVLNSLPMDLPAKGSKPLEGGDTPASASSTARAVEIELEGKELEAEQRETLPSGWARHLDEEGTPYYFNDRSGDSVWMLSEISSLEEKLPAGTAGLPSVQSAERRRPSAPASRPPRKQPRRRGLPPVDWCDWLGVPCMQCAFQRSRASRCQWRP